MCSSLLRKQTHTDIQLVLSQLAASHRARLHQSPVYSEDKPTSIRFNLVLPCQETACTNSHNFSSYFQHLSCVFLVIPLIFHFMIYIELFVAPGFFLTVSKGVSLSVTPAHQHILFARYHQINLNNKHSFTLISIRVFFNHIY